MQRVITLKGLVFVGLSSLLFYAVLKRRARSEDSAPILHETDWVSAVLAMAVFFVALGGFGWAVYQSAKSSTTHGAYARLAAVARLKEGQIQSWLEERREDVALMVNTPAFAAAIERWQAAGRAPGALQQRVLAQLEAITASRHYRMASLYSPDDGTLLLSSTPSHMDSPETRRLAITAARERRPVFEDFNPGGASGQKGVGINLFGPIYLPGTLRPVAVAHLVIEPADLLAPLLQAWPTAERTAETVMLRRDGDEMVVLNSARYRSDPGARLRLSLGDPRQVGAQLLQGKAGPVAGLDYQGRRVLAYGQPIDGTPWFILAKIDQAEAYESLNSLSVAAAMVLAVLFLVSLWWLWERNRDAALRHREQLERAVLAKRLDYLARYTSDGVLIADLSGTIVDINGRCLAQHGCERADVLGRRVEELFPPSLRQQFPALLQRLLEEGGLNYETEHERKDGRRFPVEISARAIDLEGERRIQFICRDITSRVQAERAIREREHVFNEFFHASPAGMFMLDREFRYLRVNEPLARIHGVAAADHVGRTVREVLPRVAPTLEPMLREVLEQGELVLTTEVSGETPRLPGFTQHWIMALFRIAGSGDAPPALGGVVLDISRRKRAEARILALSRLYAAISATNQAIVRGGGSLQEVLGAVCRACVAHGGFSLAWIGLPDDDAGIIVPTAAFGGGAGYLGGLVVRIGAEQPEGRGPTGVAFREQRVCVCNDLAAAEHFAPWREAAERHGLRAAMALPLRRGGRVRGTLTVYGAEENIFDDEAVALLGEMADNISFAMDQFERERLRREAEAALRQSEARLREAQAVGRIGSWEIDLATWELSGSPELYRMYGRELARGVPSYDDILGYYTPDCAQLTRDAVRHAVTRGERVEIEQQVILPGGGRAWHAFIIVPERDASGWTTRLRGTVQDITERKRAEQALNKYAAEIEDLYQRAPCGYHSLDIGGRICQINDTELQWLGYEREELIGRVAFIDLLSPEHRAAFAACFARLKETGAVRDCETELVRKDGSRLPVLINATAVLDARGGYVVSRATVYDMTERKKMESERAEHVRHLADMSRNLVAMQEEERRRLAGLLHDRTSPNLAAIRINLGIVAAELRPHMLDDVEARLDDTLALLEDTNMGIRQICTELRPALLDYAGLVPALESFAQQFAKRTGVAVRVDLAGGESRLPADVESTLFRIIQEALTNCAKHANARNIDIRLAATEAGVTLVIEDDGVGFDPALLGRGGKAPGLGLITMRERAEFAGGTLSLSSRPGGGAVIRVEIACRAQAPAGAEIG